MDGTTFLDLAQNQTLPLLSETLSRQLRGGLRRRRVHHLHVDGAAQQGVRLGPGVCVGLGELGVRGARVQRHRQAVPQL